MGISMIPACFLVRQRGAVSGAQRALVLGRQKLSLAGQRMERFLAYARGQGCDLAADRLVQDDGFSERFFRAIGYPEMEALDFTDTEGAGIIHNLNEPIPDVLKGRFDVVIDGGTTEHIFYIGNALDSCHDLLRPGGVFTSFVSCDGWFGHGVFQTGPDVPWRYWHHARGYDLLEVTVQSRKRPGQSHAVPDPSGRPRGEKMLAGPHMLLYAARRPPVDRPCAPPIQGHDAGPAEEPETTA